MPVVRWQLCLQTLQGNTCIQMQEGKPRLRLSDRCADMAADYCLAPEQQKIYDSDTKVAVPPAKERHKAHSAAYRLDEERCLAERLQRLQSGADQEPAVGDPSAEEAIARGVLLSR